ncbi:MAG: Tat pathway signal protein [Cyanobacteria bacterium RYN_339]|nr:Tat pathway signal protein [Cyanobacteria bacterium RYN_339]
MIRLAPLLALVLACGCVAARPDWRQAAVQGELQAMSAPAKDALLDEIERQHFQFFVRNSDPVTGLTKDRTTAASAASIACTGFALTAYGIAAKRGWIDRAGAAAFTRKVLGTLAKAPMGPGGQGVAGYKGFYYHFLDMHTGLRTWNCELSTVDTALMLAGARFARNFYDQPEEADIRNLADQLDGRVEWPWAMAGRPVVSMGWTPEKGFIPASWEAYNESMILVLLGLGTAGHPLPDGAWGPYTAKVKPELLYGQTHVAFGPQFGHQYSHGWVDFRGIQDPVARRLGWDWFENSRRATLAQFQYAQQNPKGWAGYGPLSWGLTACDGPGDVIKEADFGGRRVKFDWYAARGITPADPDDGTIAPTAAAASLPFAPEIVLPTLARWKRDRPDLWGPDGWADGYNDTAKWVDKDRLGIDQGPIVIMLENYRSGFVWDVMKHDPVLRRGLAKAGFTGGWVSSPAEKTGTSP